MVISYVLTNAFVGDDHQLAPYLELCVSVCVDLIKWLLLLLFELSL
jgi:hypothetical protein